MSFMETNSYIFCKHHMLFSKVNCTSSTHKILQLIWGLWKWIPGFSKYLYLVELYCKYLNFSLWDNQLVDEMGIILPLVI